MELKILDMIQLIRTPFGDFIIPLITRLGDKGAIWILLMAVLLIIPKTRKTGIVLAAALLLDLILCNSILKPLVARIRPFNVNQSINLLIAKPNDFSFPSGHTAASFAAASALLLSGNKKLGRTAVVLAFLIAFSRLYLYVHYPTDVVAGAVLGLFCGYISHFIFVKIQKRMQTIKA